MLALSADVAKAEPEMHTEYAAKLCEVAEAIAAGLPGSPDRNAVWPLIAQMVGGVLLARAVENPKLAEEIARATLEMTFANAQPDEGSQTKDAHS